MPPHHRRFAAVLAALTLGCRADALSGPPQPPSAALAGDWFVATVPPPGEFALSFSLAPEPSVGTAVTGAGHMARLGASAGFYLAVTLSGAVAPDSVVTLTAVSAAEFGGAPARYVLTGRLRPDGLVAAGTLSGGLVPTPQAITWQRP